ncbi:hypothetical protein Y1Q_0002822 [Alligator mississippiensis]|uniref:Uncharacterized protein n=1 Tax=Alligator mississippiensis TaxID=8496 RepID=A0A151NZ94_ALLMI|nr:hypothetical protein Y1Q_0002822 [Alligator mississippiensis]
MHGTRSTAWWLAKQHLAALQESWYKHNIHSSVEMMFVSKDNVTCSYLIIFITRHNSFSSRPPRISVEGRKSVGGRTAYLLE